MGRAFGLGAVAIAGLLAGIPPSGANRETTFRKDIAPIFAAKCVGCHSPRGSGPFSLQTYDDVQRRADLIRTVAILQKMPPTIVESDYGTIPRYAKLTPDETIAIQDWIRTGKPEGIGETAEPSPAPPWPGDRPSLILKNPTRIVVSAEGAVAIRTAVIEVPIDSPKDLIAFDLKPNAPMAARQAILAIEGEKNTNVFSPNGFDARQLVGPWAIGYPRWQLPETAGVRLTPGQKLRVRMLYHPTGKAEDGGFQLALYFSETLRKHQAKWRTVGTREFEIPGVPPAFTEVSASSRLEASMQVVSLIPEARRLARNVTMAARHGQEWERTLLRLWRWDPRWAGAYNFPTPPVLTLGTTLETLIQYDNSRHGDPSLSLDEAKRLPNNPSVFYGPKDTDELCWIHVQLVPYP